MNRRVPRWVRLLSASARPDRIQAVWVIIGVGTLIRLLYGVFVNDPMSGPDANGYEPTASALAANGFVANVCGLVDRHAGYPILIGLVYDLAGAEPRAFVVVQVLLFGLGAFSAYSLARRELGDRVGITALVLLMVSPALIASTTLIMYETLLGVGLVIAADLVSRSVQPGARRRLALALGGGLVLGLSATMHPKALVVALPLVALLLVRSKPAMSLAIACIAGILLGPVALGVRTATATGQLDLGQQLGISMFRYNSDNDSTTTPGTAGGRNSTARPAQERTSPAPAEPAGKPCVAPPEPAPPAVAPAPSPSPGGPAPPADTPSPLLEPPPPPTPENFVASQARKLRDFWGPMVLPAQLGHGTWFHGLNVARLAPASIEQRPWFAPATRNFQLVWSGLSAALVLLGGFLVLRRAKHRREPIWTLLIPVVMFLAVSLYTVAEARFRLPVSFFYIPLQALALTWCWNARWTRAALERLGHRPAHDSGGSGPASE